MRSTTQLLLNPIPLSTNPSPLFTQTYLYKIPLKIIIFNTFSPFLLLFLILLTNNELNLKNAGSSIILEHRVYLKK